MVDITKLSLGFHVEGMDEDNGSYCEVLATRWEVVRPHRKDARASSSVVTTAESVNAESWIADGSGKGE